MLRVAFVIVLCYNILYKVAWDNSKSAEMSDDYKLAKERFYVRRNK